jgi:hypothetical protein
MQDNPFPKTFQVRTRARAREHKPRVSNKFAALLARRKAEALFTKLPEQLPAKITLIHATVTPLDDGRAGIVAVRKP